MAIGQLLTPGQAMKLPPAAPQQGGIGGAITGFGQRAKGLWDMVGKDPAATRAAQVLALHLIGGGGGSWQKDLAQGGMAALNTFESVRQREAQQAEASRLEKKADLERAQQRADVRGDKALERLRRVTEDADEEFRHRDEMELRNRQLGLQERQVRATEQAARSPAQLSAEEREQQRVEGFVRGMMEKDGGKADDLDVYAIASDIRASRTGGAPVDPSKIAEKIFISKLKSRDDAAMLGETNLPSDEEILQSAVTNAEAISSRLASSPKSRLQMISEVRQNITTRAATGQQPTPGGRLPPGGGVLAPEVNPSVPPGASAAQGAPASPPAQGPSAPVAATPPAEPPARGRPTATQQPRPLEEPQDRTPGAWGGLESIQQSLFNNQFLGKTLKHPNGPVQILRYNAGAGQVLVRTPVGDEWIPHKALIALVNQYGVQ